MTVTYDRIANATYVKLDEGKIAKTLRISEDVLLDLGSEDNLIGIEILEVFNSLTPKMKSS